MLDGRVLEASQVEYEPFGKTPLKRESPLCSLVLDVVARRQSRHQEIAGAAQVVQNEPVAVGYAQAVCGLALGRWQSSRRPTVAMYALSGNNAQVWRGVNPVEVVALVVDKAVGRRKRALLCKTLPGPPKVAIQGPLFAAVHVDCRHPFSLGTRPSGGRRADGRLRRRCSRRCFHTSR